MNLALAYVWEGDCFKPRTPRVAKQCDQQFVIGQVYLLADENERSFNTHNHQFAWLNEAWKNLPESIADLYPTPQHLRKRALIETGWYDEEAIDCGSPAVAESVAAVIRRKDHFAMVLIQKNFLLVRTAKSQSRKSMNAADFKKSKSDMMALVEALIDVAPGTLEREAGMSA